MTAGAWLFNQATLLSVASSYSLINASQCPKLKLGSSATSAVHVVNSAIASAAVFTGLALEVVFSDARPSRP